MEQLVGIATDPVITSSVLKKGDLIEYKGARYAISRFLRAGVSHTYEVHQHPETYRVINVTVPIVHENQNSTSQYIVGDEDEETYFLVTDLSEDGTMATLKPWAGGSLDKEPRTMKVRWDEDAEIIRDGLTREDRDLFCTVKKFMGKEIMGDFNLMPRDPPVLKMPDLVMDMIFSPLSLDDLLRCRLTTPTWAYDILPLPKVFNFKDISVDEDEGEDQQLYEGVVRGLWGSGGRTRSVTILPSCLPEVIKASLFNNVDFLYIYQRPISSNMDGIRAILENCHGTKEFVYQNGCEVDLENDPIIVWAVWRGIKKFIANNHKHLEKVQWWPNLLHGGFLDVKDLFVAECPSLEIFRVNLRLESCIRNVGLLPTSISWLCLVQLSVPLGASEVSWITTNLMKLVRLDLHVTHSHFPGDDDYDDDDVNGSMIAEIAITHPSLKAMYLAFGEWGEVRGGLEDVCAKLKGIKGFLKEVVGAGGWNITNNTYRATECLDLVKPGSNDKYDSFDEWN